MLKAAQPLPHDVRGTAARLALIAQPSRVTEFELDIAAAAPLDTAECLVALFEAIGVS